MQTQYISMARMRVWRLFVSFHISQIVNLAFSDKVFAFFFQKVAFAFHPNRKIDLSFKKVNVYFQFYDWLFRLNIATFPSCWQHVFRLKLSQARKAFMLRALQNNDSYFLLNVSYKIHAGSHQKQVHVSSMWHVIASYPLCGLIAHIYNTNTMLILRAIFLVRENLCFPAC